MTADLDDVGGGEGKGVGGLGDSTTQMSRNA